MAWRWRSSMRFERSRGGRWFLARGTGQRDRLLDTERSAAGGRPLPSHGTQFVTCRPEIVCPDALVDRLLARHDPTWIVHGGGGVEHRGDRACAIVRGDHGQTEERFEIEDLQTFLARDVELLGEVPACVLDA